MEVRRRAVAYVRVSLQEMAEKGVSLDAQRSRVSSYAVASGLELVDVIEDAGESAKSLDRPGLHRARSMLRDGLVEILIVAKLDRLTREVRGWCELLDEHFKGRDALRCVEMHVDTLTAGGRFVLLVLFAAAQMEREQLGERTATAMQHKASQGEYTGGAAPYGYRIVAGAEGEAVRVEPEPSEQAVIAKARRLRGGGMSLRAIAGGLEANGMKSRSGKPFAAAQVARMLDE